MKSIRVGLEFVSSVSTPFTAEKSLFWENLESCMGEIHGLWLMMGDLNEVFDNVKK